MTRVYRVKLPRTEYWIAKRLFDDEDNGYDHWEGPFDSLDVARNELKRFQGMGLQRGDYFLLKTVSTRVPEKKRAVNHKRANPGIEHRKRVVFEQQERQRAVAAHKQRAAKARR